MAEDETQSAAGGGENPPEPNNALEVTEGGAPTGPPVKDTESAGGGGEAGGPTPGDQEEIIETARRMSADSPSGDVAGEDIARECGRDPTDAAVYDALRAASERGELACQGWHGEGGLPTRVRAGSQPSTESDK